MKGFEHMSDYRFQIVKHNEIDCLHVMIDAEEIAHTYIPIDDIQEAIKNMKKPGYYDTAERRTQGAKDGWEIRRAKQAKSP
jgi:hypothetical protein